MNALFVGMDWFPDTDGGLNRYFYEAIQVLPNDRLNGRAMVASVAARPAVPIPVDGLAPPGSGIRRRLAGSRALFKRYGMSGCDLVNSHFALYTYPWVRKMRRDQPLVVHFHGPWAQESVAESPGLAGRLQARLAWHIERSVYARASRIVTLSTAFADLVTSRYRIDRGNVTVVPGGLDLQAYLAAPPRAVARQLLGWPEDRPILLSVRRLARRMGLDLLIDAMDLVRRQMPRALLLIGGKGAMREELERRIEERGLGDNVRLLGFIPDGELPVAYAAADLSIVPTVALEGFGLITVESLASGTPVLGTSVGGTPEILRPLGPQLIFPSRDAQAMADHIVSAISGCMPLPNRTACREYARRFGWDEVAPRIRSVFGEALGAAP